MTMSISREFSSEGLTKRPSKIDDELLSLREEAVKVLRSNRAEIIRLKKENALNLAREVELEKEIDEAVMEQRNRKVAERKPLRRMWNSINGLVSLPRRNSCGGRIENTKKENQEIEESNCPISRTKKDIKIAHDDFSMLLSMREEKMKHLHSKFKAQEEKIENLRCEIQRRKNQLHADFSDNGRPARVPIKCTDQEVDKAKDITKRCARVVEQLDNCAIVKLRYILAKHLSYKNTQKMKRKMRDINWNEATDASLKIAGLLAKSKKASCAIQEELTPRLHEKTVTTFAPDLPRQIETIANITFCIIKVLLAELLLVVDGWKAEKITPDDGMIERVSSLFDQVDETQKHLKVAINFVLSKAIGRVGMYNKDKKLLKILIESAKNGKERRRSSLKN